MPKSLVRFLAQALVVLWLVVISARFLFLFLFEGGQNAMSDPVLRNGMVLGSFLPSALGALAIVAMPAKANTFFVPDRIEGAACYLCAVLRAICLLKVLSGMGILVTMLSLFVGGKNPEGVSGIVAAIGVEFGFFCLCLWFAPWLSTAVVSQVDSGVMWYTRTWRLLKGSSSPE